MAKVGQIGLSELRLAKRDLDGTVVSDSTMKVDGLVTAEVEIDMFSESFYSDDVVADVVTGFASGTVTVELLGLSLDEYGMITGQEVVNGVVVDNANVISPVLTMSFKSQKSNGKYRLVSIPQVKGTVKGESFATKEDGVEIANVEIEFAIIPMENGVWRVRCDEDATGVDATYAKSFLTTFPVDAPKGEVLRKATK